MKSLTGKILKLDADFGKSKSYTLFLMQYNRSILQLALLLRQILHHDFAFLNRFIPEAKHPNYAFQIFFSSFDVEKKTNVLLLPNRISILPASDLKNGTTDPLLGLSLFKDDFYLFNKQGFSMFKCPYIDYDFVLLVYSEKDYVISDVISQIESCKSLILKDVSYLITEDPISAEDKKRISFLKNFCCNVEMMIDSFRVDHLRNKMGPNKFIKSENSVSKHYQPDRFITGDLLDRCSE